MFSSENDETSSNSALWLLLVLHTGLRMPPTQRSHDFCLQTFLRYLLTRSHLCHLLRGVYLMFTRITPCWFAPAQAVRVPSIISKHRMEQTILGTHHWCYFVSNNVTRGSSGRLTELQLWVHISCRFLICLDINPLSYSAVVTGLDIDVLVEG